MYKYIDLYYLFTSSAQFTVLGDITLSHLLHYMNKKRKKV